jgi:hypothetical protein
MAGGAEAPRAAREHDKPLLMEFVSNLSQFLDEETEIETKIKDGCQNVIELLSNYLKTNILCSISHNNANSADAKSSAAD